jgi:DNA-binding protein HU-beta
MPWSQLVNRRDLVLAVADAADMEPKQVDALLRSLTDVITSTVSKGEPVAISGFAKFARVDRAARMGRNPATGETIKIKASRKARITPLKAFKDAVLGSRGTAAKKATPAKKKATTARKTTAKKTVARKAPAKKTTARKTTTARKAPARSTATRKTTAKKTTAKKTTAKKTTARKATKRR